MSFLIIIGIVFVIWLIKANINAVNEGKRQMKESIRLKQVKENFPEAYNEYCTWEARQRHGREMIPVVIGWSDSRWEMENARLSEKKIQKIRAEKEEKWAKEQYEFAEKCVEVAKKTMPGFGYYKYTALVSTITKNGAPSKLGMLIFQHFPESLCLDDQLDYTNVAYAKNNLENLEQFKEKNRYFRKSVYEKIIAFVKELRQNDDVLVYLNYNINGWSADTLNYHYNSIINGLGPINLITSPTNSPVGNDSKHWENQLKRKIVIIDMMTNNEWLKWNCTHIFENLRKKQPLIAYISLLKCFDKQEMIEIIKKANIEAEKRVAEECAKEERKRIEAEESKRKAEEIAEKKKKEEEIARLKALAPDVFKNSITGWECLNENFYYTWLFYYYPTTCVFEATKAEWDNRWRVWNFKNDTDKNIESEVHDEVLNELIPRIKQRLIETFGEKYLQFLTLVCLPASTKVKNIARYNKFASILCSETGMENGYEHTQVIKDGMSKKHPENTTGHSIQPVIEFNKDFFKGKYVLLFDDVVTKGGTMLRYKKIMKDIGAIVVGGLSLGKTKHERPGQVNLSPSNYKMI